jgi:uracil-DNA glycosylase family 4
MHGGLAAPAHDGAPARDCPLCPRLAAYRAANALENPDWFNAPVPSFGTLDARLLIVGMAPGVRGANRTGRPFTGDYAGVLLYDTLLKFGFASGRYGADPADGLTLNDCRITNAVRCVPPANLPLPVETATCNRFLAAELAAMPALRVVLSLGVLSHAAMLRASALPATRLRFRHGEMHTLPDGLKLANSYHVSRYNTSTRRLSSQMFEDVVDAVREELSRAP